MVVTPEIGSLAVTQFNWPSFRATIDKALKLRPDIDINKLPIDFSDDAKILLNIAAFHGCSLSNPLHLLRYIPPMFMEFLSYQFFIACDDKTWEEFNPSSQITIIKQKLDNDCLLLLTTGTLNAWHQSIITNLSRNWKFSHDTRILFCKIMLAFERERGLGFLFERYRKKMQQDHTFLLEKK